MFGPPFTPTLSKAPPPRSGFAIRDPAPPKEKFDDVGEVEEARPRVEPSLAASRRSLTAAS